MNCPSCNHPITGNEDYCPVCGISLGEFYKKKSNNRNKAMLAVSISAAAIAFVLFCVSLSFFISDKDDDFVAESDSSNGFIATPSPSPAPIPGKDTVSTEEVNKKTVQDVENAIDNYISSYANSNSVAVSIYDNNTHLQYNSNQANSQFSAWGFYVPIYLAYRGEYGNELTSYYILSSNPTECNEAANDAMDYFGGPSGITTYISQNFNTSVTSYGRKFGQSVPGKDNYTTSREAARLMNIFYEKYSYSSLSYKPDSFGISFPQGATVYSQLGTENLNVKNCLNVYAIVHGNFSNYSIAILTRDGTGNNGFVSNLMSFVHDEMEGIAKNG